MIYYNRIDVSESIYINKTIESKKFVLCQYRYFLNKGFRFQSSVCIDCYDVLMMSIYINNIAILNIHGVNYCCIISGISKSETINLFKNADFIEKRGTFMKHKKIIFIMAKEIITFGDIQIEKRKFHYSKYPIKINNVDVDKK